VSKIVSGLVALALVGALVVTGGCSSCQQSAPTPAPVAKGGRLPRPPEAAATAAAEPESPPGCAVVAGASVEEGAAPLEVQFSSEGMCLDAEGTYTWDFGDGSAASHEPNPTHTYTAAGTYTARVTLEDPENNVKDSDELPITVTTQQP